ncbi:alpha/beta hydrolase [Caulobacter sp. 17J80-11]|uniref:alpha/beta hydrolase n=1 Tax=Caulobacter sp. 17J80-11 TaxID=2763502 RepID=UPI0016535EDA|nr:alpha/beta hydrolase [Caulobacter sp. 17J80-11]MBC6982714.1 alpha/beta hydrolase [Caulobacter sp. 17J80-11]
MVRVARLLSALLGALLLTACASTPEAFLRPVGPAPPGGSTVDMLIVTTRKPSPDPGVLFTGERGIGYRTTEIVVSIPPEASRKIGDVEWPKTNTPDPAKEFAVLSVRPLELGQATDWFTRTAGADGRLLVFVHGFNTRFESAVFRFAQIVHDSGAPMAPVLFTWPSRGSVFAYVYDRESANYSRNALEAALTRAAKAPEVKDITILAHSMGTYLTMEALRQTAVRQGRVPAKITNVVLAAPDIDIDVFREQYESLGPEKPHFTIFVSTDDRALSLSRFIAGDVGRLGAVDPAKEPWRSRLEAHPGVTVIDLSKLKTGDPFNHEKFVASPQIVQVLGGRLAQGQKLSDYNPSLGEQVGVLAVGAGRTVGTAAGVVVAAPLAIVDPNTRDRLSEQAAPLAAEPSKNTTEAEPQASPQPETPPTKPPN